MLLFFEMSFFLSTQDLKDRVEPPNWGPEPNFSFKKLPKYWMK